MAKIPLAYYYHFNLQTEVSVMQVFLLRGIIACFSEISCD